MFECVFCNADPCVCNVRAISKPLAQQAKSRRNHPAGKRIEAAKSERPKLAVVRGDSTIVVQKTERSLAASPDLSDPEWSATVRALAPILTPQFRQENAHILQAEPSWEERVVAFGRRRAWRLHCRG